MTAYEGLVDWLCENGFRRSRAADRYGHEVWARKGVAITVTEDCSASAAEALRMRAVHDMSMLRRKPKTARARETAEKKAAALVKRRQEFEERIALRNRELGGLRAVLSSAEAREVIRKVEADERELRRIKSLMTAIPQTNAHAGRVHASHRS